MKKGMNPLTIILFLISIILSAVIAFAVKHIFASQLGNFASLVFLLVFVILGGAGAFLIGRFVRR